MHESKVDIPTRDGQMDTFVCHPEKGGPFPSVIFYMDAPGIREELRDMARRIGSVGYCVILPNLYYRATHADRPLFEASRIHESDDERQKMWKLMMSIADNSLLISDTAAMLDYLSKEPAAGPAPYGCVGYCMSGQYVFSAAGAYPEQFAAAASIYGVGLITDRPDSPHLLAEKVNAELYLAFAEVDRYVPEEVLAELPKVLDEHSVKHRIEVYPGTEHGFAFPQRHCYDKQAAERHWERLFALFRRRLS